MKLIPTQLKSNHVIFHMGYFIWPRVGSGIIPETNKDLCCILHLIYWHIFETEGIGELETRFSGVKDFDKNNTAYKIIITFGRDGYFSEQLDGQVLAS